jgi:hypothetical protein
VKKTLVIALVILFSLSACIPDFLQSGTQDEPEEAVDIAATVMNTEVAQTFEALDTPTLVEATFTASPTETMLPSETATEFATNTATFEASETPTGTLATDIASLTPDGTLPAETATEPEGTISPTVTGTLEAEATSIYPSATSPISINQPPASVPRYKISVENKTKGKVYISLQGVTEGGYRPIIEYDIPAGGKANFKIPEGQYTAVVYVGKEPMIGYFGIHAHGVNIIITRDKIQIKK